MQLPENIPEAKLWAVILGAAGAAVSLTFIKDLTWQQKLAMGISGVVMSVAGAITAAIRKADLWGLVSDLIRSWFARKGG